MKKNLKIILSLASFTTLPALVSCAKTIKNEPEKVSNEQQNSLFKLYQNQAVKKINDLNSLSLQNLVKNLELNYPQNLDENQYKTLNFNLEQIANLYIGVLNLNKTTPDKKVEIEFANEHKIKQDIVQYTDLLSKLNKEINLDNFNSTLIENCN
ncbi:hypothetical protein EG856_02165 [Mycoplasmopsis phocirhinis]|uniref:Lipoprotein n=1 Tax=Mycoplasmopsis phocirhinis TaxID=142650 RepID=A0A4V0ZAH4_9BACT|nr:hypothetical protein [Mycoplasmopsis phocirhinis]QBF34712.1 hypothetical protein EG856_02165 [Mycoplasmopsis phocirhinis]